MNTGKILKFTLLGGLFWFGFKKATAIKSFYDTFDFTIKAKLNSIKNGNIIIKSSVQIDNPTSANFKMSFPYIKVIDSAGSVVAKSTVQNQEIDIKAKSTAFIDNIEIQIPIIKFAGLLVQVGPDVVTKLRALIDTGKMPESFTLGAKFNTQTIFDFDMFRDIIVNKTVEI